MGRSSGNELDWEPDYLETSVLCSADFDITGRFEGIKTMIPDRAGKSFLPNLFYFAGISSRKNNKRGIEASVDMSIVHDGGDNEENTPSVGYVLKTSEGRVIGHIDLLMSSVGSMARMKDVFRLFLSQYGADYDFKTNQLAPYREAAKEEYKN